MEAMLIELSELAKESELKPRSLDADEWVANSLLQKAIRRGAIEPAQNAALTFFQKRGPAIWRRFVVIAFEDVGAADPSMVSRIVQVCSNSVLRRRIANDETIACNVAAALARTVKSRSAEHLITVAKFHQSLDPVRANIGRADFASCLADAVNPDAPAATRALALWRASAIGWPDASNRDVRVADLLSAYEGLGIPSELTVATHVGLRKARDPIILMAALAWLLRQGQGVVVERAAPPWINIKDVPSYALDKHTLLGRSAIRNFVKRNSAVRGCLARYVNQTSLNDAAYMAAFYTDAAPLVHQLDWEGGDALERLAIEADLMRVGVAEEGVQPILEVLREHLSELNRHRADVFYRTRQFDAAVALVGGKERNP